MSCLGCEAGVAPHPLGDCGRCPVRRFMGLGAICPRDFGKKEGRPDIWGGGSVPVGVALRERPHDPLGFDHHKQGVIQCDGSGVHRGDANGIHSLE